MIHKTFNPIPYNLRVSTSIRHHTIPNPYSPFPPLFIALPAAGRQPQAASPSPPTFNVGKYLSLSLCLSGGRTGTGFYARAREKVPPSSPPANPS